MAATRPWSRSDVLLAGGAAVALAASADTAWSAHARFAVDLSGLSPPERAAAALWDFRPLAAAIFALAAVALAAGLFEPAGRLAAAREPLRSGLVLLAAAHVAFALVVVALAVWVGAAGRVGDADELGFSYSASERAVTLATQALAWVPLAAFLGVLALRGVRPDGAEAVQEEPAREPAGGEVTDEMEALWRERLAFGPRRERARTLLERVRALENAGEIERARELAEEMRRL
ncbi:MAG TPA: hypothetical protein VE289_08580 [Gaiellaceae bacterium]|jgi:hypothetical protein|nr:hypothetical protein [Gaiellaceae bacterium]